MAKEKKASKPRPDKYAEKVHVNVGFDEALKLFSDIAHENNSAKIEEPEAPEAEQC